MRKNIICLFLSVLFLCGCAKPVFHFTLRNDGTKELEDAHITFEKFQSIGGYLSPSAEKTHMLVNYYYPLPPKVVVSWRTPDGEKHSVEVEVKKHAPAKYKNLNVYFLIDDDNKVTVKFTEDYSATIK